MKTKIYLSFALIGALSLFFSCAKDAVHPGEDTLSSPTGQEGANGDNSGEEYAQPGTEGKTLSLRMTLPENLTRISMTQDGEEADGAVKLAWQIGDVIQLIDHDNAENATTLGLLSIIDAHNAVFTGNFIEANSYDILYGAASVADATATAFASQTQSGNASTAHLGYIALLEDVTLEDSDWETGVAFSASWASAHDGTFRHTGALRLRILLPNAVTDVKKATIIAPSALFYTTNALSTTTDAVQINFSTSADVSSSHILTAYASLPWEAVSVPADTDFELLLETADHDFYHRSFAAGEKTFETGKVNAIKLECNDPGTNVTLDDFAGGSGVEGDPYLIGNQRQMRRMDANMTAGQVTWFKLIDDITMSDDSWTALNNTPDGSSVYSKYIHFDGNNKTVSNLRSSGPYASLFGVLNGTVQNLTIDSAVITPGSSKCGVLAGFIGSGGTQAVSVSGITISNSQVGTSAVPGTSYCGILAAQASRAGTSISGITLTDSQVYGASGVGGALAYVAAGTTLSGITVSGCTIHTSTTTTSTSGANNNHSAGGLIGRNDASLTVSGTNRVENTDVTGYSTVGGAIGFINFTATISGITFCGNGTKGIITGNKQYLGGIAGSASGSVTVISDCRVEYATIDAASITNDARAGGFAGMVNNEVTVSGCSVGTPSQKVTVRLGTPSASGKVLNSGGFVGVHYGTITKNGNTRTTAYATVTCTNTNTGWQLNIGGFCGFLRGSIEYSDAVVTMSGLKGMYIGGFGGYATREDNVTPCLVDHCTVSGTVTGNNYTGGFVGYADNTPVFSNNTSSGSVTAQSAVGGFLGYSKSGTFTGNTSSATVSGSNNTGGFVGWAQAGTYTANSSTGAVSANSSIGGFAGLLPNATFRKCYATGNVTASSDNAGGFIGQINGAATVENCYATGTVSATGQFAGGLIGKITNVTTSLSYCYSCGAISSARAAAGLIGRIEGSNVSVSHCAAWSASATASSYGAGSWSGGAVVGVTFPTCTLTDNYRKPGMALTAYWGNTGSYTYLLADDYQHANVDSSHPLIKQNGSPTTATSLASDQDSYPIWPHHGKVELATGSLSDPDDPESARLDKTLSQLASTTLGWDSEIWDFSGDLPVLR